MKLGSMIDLVIEMSVKNIFAVDIFIGAEIRAIENFQNKICKGKAKNTTLENFLSRIFHFGQALKKGKNHNFQ